LARWGLHAGYVAFSVPGVLRCASPGACCTPHLLSLACRHCTSSWPGGNCRDTPGTGEWDGVRCIGSHGPACAVIHPQATKVCLQSSGSGHVVCMSLHHSLQLPTPGSVVLGPSLSLTCSWEHVAWLGAPAGMVLHPDGYLVVCDMTKASRLLSRGCLGWAGGRQAEFADPRHAAHAGGSCKLYKLCTSCPAAPCAVHVPQGLLAVDPRSGAVQLLATRLTNASLARSQAAIQFCDDVDVSRNGKIYFSGGAGLNLRRHGTGCLGAAMLYCYSAPLGKSSNPALSRVSQVLLPLPYNACLPSPPRLLPCRCVTHPSAAKPAGRAGPSWVFAADTPAGAFRLPAVPPRLAFVWLHHCRHLKVTRSVPFAAVH